MSPLLHVTIEAMVKKALFLVLGLFLILAGYFFVGKAEPAKEINWGVNFSQKQAQLLGLDWQTVYISLFDDLGAKDIKLATYWDLIEPEEGRYNFEDLDWQIDEAEKRDAKILLVIGMKTPRWPECHAPQWAKIRNSKHEIQNSLLLYIETLVRRYRGNSSVWAWQVENEPLFPFGECPWADKKFLKKEIELVKSLDPTRQIVISDSGEGSLWVEAAKLGDLVGVTMYKKVWFKEIKRYVQYPLPSVFYWRKAELIKKIFNKEVMVVELQAEPWCHVSLDKCQSGEQQKTMNLEKFGRNIEFAKKTGLNKFYLWGAEWWFWMKEKQNDPRIWDEAKKLF